MKKIRNFKKLFIALTSAALLACGGLCISANSNAENNQNSKVIDNVPNDSKLYRNSEKSKAINEEEFKEILKKTKKEENKKIENKKVKESNNNNNNREVIIVVKDEKIIEAMKKEGVPTLKIKHS